MKKYSIALIGLGMSASLWANEAALKAQLEKMGAGNVTIHASVLPNFKTAVTDQGVLHISENGRFVLQGQVFEIKDGKAIDITHKALLAELNALEKEMIVYPAKQEKHVVTVFMDITCHYCHLLHSKIADYNAKGITVRYLAFPRGGMNTQTAKQMEAIWTDSNPVFALNEAEAGRLPKTVKTPSMVKRHYELGLKFGVNGTPNMVTQQGELIRGYVEPDELAEMLAE